MVSAAPCVSTSPQKALLPWPAIRGPIAAVSIERSFHIAVGHRHGGFHLERVVGMIPSHPEAQAQLKGTPHQSPDGAGNSLQELISTGAADLTTMARLAHVTNRG